MSVFSAHSIVRGRMLIMGFSGRGLSMLRCSVSW